MTEAALLDYPTLARDSFGERVASFFCVRSLGVVFTSDFSSAKDIFLDKSSKKMYQKIYM